METKKVLDKHLIFNDRARLICHMFIVCFYYISMLALVFEKGLPWAVMFWLYGNALLFIYSALPLFSKLNPSYKPGALQARLAFIVRTAILLVCVFSTFIEPGAIKLVFIIAVGVMFAVGLGMDIWFVIITVKKYEQTQEKVWEELHSVSEDDIRNEAKIEKARNMSVYIFACYFACILIITVVTISKNLLFIKPSTQTIGMLIALAVVVLAMFANAIRMTVKRELMYNSEKGYRRTFSIIFQLFSLLAGFSLQLFHFFAFFYMENIDLVALLISVMLVIPSLMTAFLVHRKLQRVRSLVAAMRFY